MPGERVAVASSAIREVAFLEPDSIFVVPLTEAVVYRYDGFGRDTFTELVNSDSVGAAWRPLLQTVMQEQGRTSEKLSLDEFEALFNAPPAEYDFTGVTSSYAW